MRRKRMVYLLLFAVLILIFSSCHPRHVSDIRPNMTKEEVASLWGKTPLITHRTANGKTTETWEYHFLNSNAICWVTFYEDRVVATRCRPLRGRGYGYDSQSEQNRPDRLSTGQGLVREGFFAMKLAEALKVGPVKDEAEAESVLASMGIMPKNGWIADYPLTPDVIDELQNAVGAAADAGKIAMGRDEAMRVFQELILNMEDQNAGVESLSGGEPYPEPYYYPELYYYPSYYPYDYPYLFSYGGFYRYHYRHAYPHHRHRR